MIALLDTQVLIALFDAAHVHHLKAHDWLTHHRKAGWASCPISQNACIRIIAQPAYPGRLSVADITRRLRLATEADDHHFWPDSISLCEMDRFDPSSILSSRQLTDLYLLALAVSHGGKLITFDQGINPEAVVGSNATHLEVLN